VEWFYWLRLRYMCCSVLGISAVSARSPTSFGILESCERVAGDETIDNLTGFGRDSGISDHRLNTASSCIGCHIDGMNRINNDLRDWLDEEGGRRLPKGEYGVDAWVNDPATVARVRELYPPSSEIRAKIENDRRVYLTAMAEIKQDMILGIDKNIYVEPAIWTTEWARNFYGYPVTRSN
jgi:hypothetical protein